MNITIIKKLLIVLIFTTVTFAGNGSNKKDSTAAYFNGLKWRGIGPAFTSGRIADIAVNPQKPNEYFVAAASGNIWKTTNWGTTFEPVFDNYGAYSIGCLAIDPQNPNIVWAGTGENNHQRALGYGDGVYKSVDGGKSWKNMGLKDSRQIGKILIDPRNGNVVYVAAEGSVWGPGGDRGLYKTTDGGKTWNKILEISENTGVNNVVFEPGNPDVLYATSEQRRRHVFTKIGGGPESAVYKSTDGGKTWNKIMNGLPNVDIGGMGICVSPVDPNTVYLIVEAALGKGGFFRSTNRGASWEKMSDYTASGQYFNEIFCDPKDVNKVYAMDVRSKVTTDGGKTWKPIGNKNRHVDDHAMWIDPENTAHFLIGGDGGIYETFDGGKTFDFKENLPITQFYRVFVDDRKPFYTVYGGTQDNSSMGGPSRTLSADGIVNSDWFVTNGGDGFWSAVDPVNPDIVYAESQYAGMVRYDRKSGESVSIRPEPEKGQNSFRWNWDTPLIVSPHKHTRIYCAAERVFRSEDRGDSWTQISGDLTAQIDRNSFKVMGKYWSIDAVAKDKSTSLFGTIVSLAESPLKENLLYAGTDDGVIQVSEDAKTWRKTGKFPGVPKYTYVSDIVPSKFDENVVFATFNNHKRDDFKPYVLKSTDKGRTWKSISGNLPGNGPVNTFEQDFIDPDLLFVGTEFGFFFSTNGGESWTQLKSGLPTISVKDIALQKSQNDIVIATFGRGFYILDDYTPLRNINKKSFEKEAILFPVRDALMYIQQRARYAQGSDYFKAPNPPFGATFTYYLKEVPKTLREIRHEKEKKLFEESKPIPQTSEDELRREENEIPPYLVFTVEDESGNPVRRLTAKPRKGINRVTWDLRYASTRPLSEKDKFDPLKSLGSSTLVMPGRYKVSLSIVTREGKKELDSPQEFNAVPLRNTTLPAPDRKELVAFQKKVNELSRTIRGTYRFLNETINRVDKMMQAVLHTPQAPYGLFKEAGEIKERLREISLKFHRPSNKPSEEENPPAPVTFNHRLNVLAYTHWRSTSAITQTERDMFNILTEEFPPVLDEIKSIYNNKIKKLEAELEKYKVPWSPGRLPDFKF